MERLTSNKNIPEMSITELAHNSCYAKDRKARYRDYDMDMDARELVIQLLDKHADIPNEFTCDEDLDGFILDSTQYGMGNIIGLIAVFYQNLWAMADLRERLKEYEDLEEQGKLLILPSPNWMDIVFGEQETFWGIDTDYMENPVREITVDNSGRIEWYGSWETVVLKGTDENGLDWEFSPVEIGITVFTTREQAEEALKKIMEENSNE